MVTQVIHYGSTYYIGVLTVSQYMVNKRGSVRLNTSGSKVSQNKTCSGYVRQIGVGMIIRVYVKEVYI